MALVSVPKSGEKSYKWVENGVKLESSELPNVKTLGVRWNASEDVFTFVVKESNLSFYTKRGLLSRIATLFDPLQYLAPYIIRAKLALQEAWLRGPGCEFPDDLKLITYQWAKQLPKAPQVKIPRCYRQHEEAVEDVTLHAFVDASRRAYATVSYARYEHASGQISVALTPIKSVSVPRFELMAAVLGVLLAGL